jgi:hypothetical protein
MMHRFLAPARAELEEAVERYEARRRSLEASVPALRGGTFAPSATPESQTDS